MCEPTVTMSLSTFDWLRDQEKLLDSIIKCAEVECTRDEQIVTIDQDAAGKILAKLRTRFSDDQFDEETDKIIWT